MKYEYAEDLQKIAEDVSRILFPHVKLGKIKCFRSFGTNSRRTIARCHALGKLMQTALEIDAFYALEFLHERFDKLDEEEQLKVIIHELMHIPFTFGGGFKHHNVVNSRSVEKAYYLYKKQNGSAKSFF
jgi:predicted metallopeptidase